MLVRGGHLLAGVMHPGRNFDRLLVPIGEAIADASLHRRKAAGFAVADSVGVEVAVVVRTSI